MGEDQRREISSPQREPGSEHHPDQHRGCNAAHAEIRVCGAEGRGLQRDRFGSKQDLLPLLLTRLQTNARRELEDELGKPHWNGCGLIERVNALIEMFAGVQIQRQRIIRACVAGRLTASLQMSEQDLADARASLDAMRRWLLVCREEIRHEHPDSAVRLGLYMCLQSLQTALLFETLPPDVSAQTMTTEAKRMLGRYLSGEAV